MNQNTYLIKRHLPNQHDRTEELKSSDKAYQLITKKEVASLLAISKRTVDRLVSVGDLPRPFKVGGCTRFRRIEILNFINSATTTGR